MVMVENTDYVIEGLELVFIELPKFTPKNFNDKRMKVLWLRYLTEIDEDTREVPGELLESPEIVRAVEQLEESAFTEAQLLGYDKFWDMVRVEKTLYSSAERRGLAKGYAEGMAQGIKEGKAEGMAQGIKQGMAQGIEQGMAQGKAEGLAEGIAKGRLDTIAGAVLKMREKGHSNQYISDILGLTEEDLAKLL